MEMPGRFYDVGIVNRNGYQGSEKDKEFNTNTYTTFFREIDTRIGRWWSPDPKPVIGESPYLSMSGNPVFYNDIKGDSLPVRFLNKQNDLYRNYESEIPLLVQKMFNEEYGIKVGYNTKSKMLYYDGDFETENKVSPTARKKIMSILNADYNERKSRKKFGVIYFGTNGMQKLTGGKVGGPEAEHSLHIFGMGPAGNVYINLDSYNDDLTSKLYDYSGLTDKGISPRTFNLAREFEHEWFGHSMGGRGDPGVGDFKTGKAEVLPNLFRTEMGLPLRSNYGTQTIRGTVVLFGLDSKQVKKVVNDIRNEIQKVPHVLRSVLKR